MKKLAFAAAAAFALFAAPALAADSPAAGEWAVEAKTDFGTFKSDWTVAEAEGAWTLEMADQPMEGGPGGPPPESTITNLKVDGGKLTFDRALDMGGQAFSMSYDLTVEGDTLSGTANSDFGPIPISGTRK
jgi:opacity protein-like surface antigen